MGFFHIHNWKEIARTYAPSLLEQGGKGNGYLSNALQSGMTTILWECQDRSCQKLRKQEMLGKEWVTTK